MTTIYRVENKKREGIYYGDGYLAANLMGGDKRSGHPAPWRDSILKKYFREALIGGWDGVQEPVKSWDDNHTLRFGFSSVEQLESWIRTSLPARRSQKKATPSRSTQPRMPWWAKRRRSSMSPLPPRPAI